MFYVYFVKSKKYNENYVGSTNDLRRRLFEHNNGTERSTKRYRPWQLVYYEAYRSEKDAREREKKLKQHKQSLGHLKKRIRHSIGEGEKENKEKRGLPPTFPKSGGFTLIEIMIAIFILAVGVTAVLTMFPLGIQIVSFSKMATIATHLGGAKIEEIISTPYGEISTEAKQALDSPFSAYSRQTEVTCFDPNDDLSPNCPDTGIKKIEVTISWKSPLGVAEKSIKITTLINQK